MPSFIVDKLVSDTNLKIRKRAMKKMETEKKEIEKNEWMKNEENSSINIAIDRIIIVT